MLDRALGAPGTRLRPGARRRAGAAGTLGAAATAAAACAAATRAARAAMVRVLPRARPTVVDGSARRARRPRGASARCRDDRALRYAADLDARRAARRGGRDGGVVRGQRLQPPPRVRRRSRCAATPARRCPPTSRSPRTRRCSNPFAARGPDAQTVARAAAACATSARRSRPASPQFPEHRPFAALDGDPRPPGSPTARSTLTAPPRRRRASRARATSPTSTCCPTATRAARDTRGRRQRPRVRRCTRAGTACASGCAARTGICGADRDGRRSPRRGRAAPAAIRELRIPGVHATRGAAPAGARRARAARAPT